MGDFDSSLDKILEERPGRKRIEARALGIFKGRSLIFLGRERLSGKYSSCFYGVGVMPFSDCTEPSMFVAADLYRGPDYSLTILKASFGESRNWKENFSELQTMIKSVSAQNLAFNWGVLERAGYSRSPGPFI
jgi:hypothetical protein